MFRLDTNHSRLQLIGLQPLLKIREMGKTNKGDSKTKRITVKQQVAAINKKYYERRIKQQTQQIEDKELQSYLKTLTEDSLIDLKYLDDNVKAVARMTQLGFRANLYDQIQPNNNQSELSTLTREQMHSIIVAINPKDNFEMFDLQLKVYFYIVLVMNEGTYRHQFLDPIIAGKTVSWFSFRQAIRLISPTDLMNFRLRCNRMSSRKDILIPMPLIRTPDELTQLGVENVETLTIQGDVDKWPTAFKELLHMPNQGYMQGESTTDATPTKPVRKIRGSRKGTPVFKELKINDRVLRSTQVNKSVSCIEQVKVDRTSTAQQLSAEQIFDEDLIQTSSINNELPPQFNQGGQELEIYQIYCKDDNQLSNVPSQANGENENSDIPNSITINKAEFEQELNIHYNPLSDLDEEMKETNLSMVKEDDNNQTIEQIVHINEDNYSQMKKAESQLGIDNLVVKAADEVREVIQPQLISVFNEPPINAMEGFKQFNDNSGQGNIISRCVESSLQSYLDKDELIYQQQISAPAQKCLTRAAAKKLEKLKFELEQHAIIKQGNVQLENQILVLKEKRDQNISDDMDVNKYSSHEGLCELLRQWCDLYSIPHIQQNNQELVRQFHQPFNHEKRRNKIYGKYKADKAFVKKKNNPYDPATSHFRIVSPYSLKRQNDKSDLEKLKITFLDSQRKQNGERIIIHVAEYEGLSSFGQQALKSLVQKLTIFTDYDTESYYSKTEGHQMMRFANIQVQSKREFMKAPNAIRDAGYMHEMYTMAEIQKLHDAICIKIQTIDKPSRIIKNIDPA